jgi:hypothetical protein
LSVRTCGGCDRPRLNRPPQFIIVLAGRRGRLAHHPSSTYFCGSAVAAARGPTERSCVKNVPSGCSSVPPRWSAPPPLRRPARPFRSPRWATCPGAPVGGDKSFVTHSVRRRRKLTMRNAVRDGRPHWCLLSLFRPAGSSDRVAVKISPPIKGPRAVGGAEGTDTTRRSRAATRRAYHLARSPAIDSLGKNHLALRADFWRLTHGGRIHTSGGDSRSGRRWFTCDRRRFWSHHDHHGANGTGKTRLLQYLRQHKGFASRPRVLVPGGRRSRPPQNIRQPQPHHRTMVVSDFSAVD